jgi:hypothetical protein
MLCPQGQPEKNIPGFSGVFSLFNHEITGISACLM